MHGHFYSLAVGGAPRQTRLYRTCNSLLLNGHKNMLEVFYYLHLHNTFILWGYNDDDDRVDYG